MSKKINPVYGTRTQLTDQTFCFACNPQVPCFTRCCHDADMYLYPYDIIRLKKRLGMTSGEFLEHHTHTAIRDNPYFPNVMLQMTETGKKPCPFLSEKGCAVYEDRPFSCRAYPLEPAVSRRPGEQGKTLYFITRHHYCLGHEQPDEQTIGQWIDSQGLAPFVEMNNTWVPVDSLLRENPWSGRGLDNPGLRMAYMACYNVDAFREFIFNSSFLERFTVPESRLTLLREDDVSLMQFGFDWVRFLLTDKGPVAGMKNI